MSSLSVWPVYPLWGYFYSALAVALMPATLLAYERDRSRRRLSHVTFLLGLACSWLRPWQGVTVIAVIVVSELLLYVNGRRGRSASIRVEGPGRPTLTTFGLVLGALIVPLVYYFVLGRVDPAWKTAQSAFGNTIIEPAWWTVALAIAPLMLPGALAYRHPPRDFQQAAVRVWPFASLSLVWLIADGGVSIFAPHALQGLSIPLAILAVNGLSSLRAGPATLRTRTVTWAAIALLIVPSTVDALVNLLRDIDDDENHPYFLQPSERHALTYLDGEDRKGAVLTPARLGSAVPALTGRHTRVGHLSWTPGFFSVASIVDRVFVGYLGPANTRAFFRNQDVKFILSGCTNTDLAGFLRPMLASIHRFGCATVYTVGHVDASTPAERSRLIRRAEGEMIRLSDGSIPIASAAGVGSVDDVKIDNNILAVTGWAVDRRHGRPDYILAFAGDHPLASGIPRIDRPDVVQAYPDYPAKSGFRIDATLPLPPSSGPSQRLRVFAVADGEAGEIPPADGVSPLLER